MFCKLGLWGACFEAFGVGFLFCGFVGYTDLLTSGFGYFSFLGCFRMGVGQTWVEGWVFCVYEF